MIAYPRKSCCFATGHRSVPQAKRSEILARIRESAECLIQKGIIHFIAGGANGFDMWFATVILELKTHHPEITLTLMLPDKDYTTFWTKEERLVQEEIKRLADEVTTIPKLGSREPALTRDDAMVAAGGTCICYLRSEIGGKRGGTRYTVRKAIGAGCDMIALYQVGDYDKIPTKKLR